MKVSVTYPPLETVGNMRITRYRARIESPEPKHFKIYGVGIGGKLIKINYEIDSNHDFVRPNHFICPNRATFKTCPPGVEGG